MTITSSSIPITFGLTKGIFDTPVYGMTQKTSFFTKNSLQRFENLGGSVKFSIEQLDLWKFSTDDALRWLERFIDVDTIDASVFCSPKDDDSKGQVFYADKIIDFSKNPFFQKLVTENSKANFIINPLSFLASQEVSDFYKENPLKLKLRVRFLNTSALTNNLDVLAHFTLIDNYHVEIVVNRQNKPIMDFIEKHKSSVLSCAKYGRSGNGRSTIRLADDDLSHLTPNLLNNNLLKNNQIDVYCLYMNEWIDKNIDLQFLTYIRCSHITFRTLDENNKEKLLPVLKSNCFKKLMEKNTFLEDINLSEQTMSKGDFEGSVDICKKVCHKKMIDSLRGKPSGPMTDHILRIIPPKFSNETNGEEAKQ